MAENSGTLALYHGCMNTLQCPTCGRTFVERALSPRTAHRCKCGYMGFFKVGR